MYIIFLVKINVCKILYIFYKIQTMIKLNHDPLISRTTRRLMEPEFTTIKTLLHYLAT